MAESSNVVPINETNKSLTVVDWDDDVFGEGMEGVTRDELLTPILKFLHYQCPEKDEPSSAKYVDGAEAGMILNIATRQLHSGGWDIRNNRPLEDGGFDTIICGRNIRYAIYIPRPQGGAGGGSADFRGFLEANDPVVERLIAEHRRGRIIPPLPWRYNGEDVVLVQTAELFIMYGEPPLTTANAQFAIINFKSAGLPVYQGYISTHHGWTFPGPQGTKPRVASIYAYRWRLRVRPTSNAKGKFFAWSIQLAPPAKNYLEAVVAGVQRTPAELERGLLQADNGLFLMAREASRRYREGEVKYDEREAGDDTDDVDPTARDTRTPVYPTSNTREPDDEIPF